MTSPLGEGTWFRTVLLNLCSALEPFVQMKPYLEAEYVKQISREPLRMRLGVGDPEFGPPPATLTHSHPCESSTKPGLKVT